MTRESFHRAVGSLDSLSDRLRAAPTDFAAARQRGALLEITGDFVAFSDVLLDVHDAAVAFEAKQEEAGLLDPEPLPRPMRVVRRLHATYRSFFFLSRELQDHAFGALLATCPGCSLPPYPSMNAAANPRNPVRVLLDKAAPDYWEWFDRWRTLRNRLKDGISVQLVGPRADLGIGFSIEDGDVHLGSHVVRLADAAETLERSAAVVDAVVGRLHARFS
jgi:hypothetical protein